MSNENYDSQGVALDGQLQELVKESENAERELNQLRRDCDIAYNSISPEVTEGELANLGLLLRQRAQAQAKWSQAMEARRAFENS